MSVCVCVRACVCVCARAPCVPPASSLQLPAFLLSALFLHIPMFNCFLSFRLLNTSITQWSQFALATPVLFGPARRFFSAAARALPRGAANMDVLVSLGTSTAYAYSVLTVLLQMGDWSYRGQTFFETSAMLIAFILFGKYLEVSVGGREESLARGRGMC